MPGQAKRFRELLCAFLATMVGWAVVHGTACSPKQEPQEEPEVLVYCGITMIKPMAEIAEIIEQQENCSVIITKGGSGNLLRAIRINKAGDLYLPGSDSYIKTAMEENLVTEAREVGANKAALMVKKGNPKNIKADLSAMKDPQYNIVIGNPESGSIGRETKKILDRAEMFEDVSRRALRLTTDSKDLIKVLKDGEADLVINWFATSTWPENRDYVDALPIDANYASKKKLVLGLLSYSKHPDIARKFMAYAASDQGKAIFRKYGLYDVE